MLISLCAGKDSIALMIEVFGATPTAAFYVFALTEMALRSVSMMVIAISFERRCMLFPAVSFRCSAWLYMSDLLCIISTMRIYGVEK